MVLTVLGNSSAFYCRRWGIRGEKKEGNDGNSVWGIIKPRKYESKDLELAIHFFPEMCVTASGFADIIDDKVVERFSNRLCFCHGQNIKIWLRPKASLREYFRYSDDAQNRSLLNQAPKSQAPVADTNISCQAICF